MVKILFILIWAELSTNSLIYSLFLIFKNDSDITYNKKA